MFGPSLKYSYSSNYKYNGYLLFSLETVTIKAVPKDDVKHTVKKVKISPLNEVSISENNFFLIIFLIIVYYYYFFFTVTFDSVIKLWLDFGHTSMFSC